EDGWRVLAWTRNPDSVALKQLVLQFQGHVQVHALDVADHAQIEKLSHDLSAERIDVLINNAGIYPANRGDSFHQIDYAAWAYAFEVNTMAPLKMADAFYHQIARSDTKKIVTITSKMASISDNTSGGSYVYRSSKSAVNSVIKSLSIDLESKGVIVALLHPGWVRTEMGGPNALISAEKSVTGMRQVIADLIHTDSGKFFAYDGQIISW
ncbi:MAG: SDR family oxidoreductase, partial [Nitrosomonas sp.]|nr:SDR family oxidoreductase [Nitrosomonas sp.]